VSRPATGKVVKPQNAIALLLFSVILVIVIAPSVDLEPTVLRATHVCNLGLLLAAATAVALMPLVRETFSSGFLPIDNRTLASGDFALLTHSLRC